MPPEPDPIPADSENNTPDAPATRPAPLQDPRDKPNIGCILMLMALFLGVFLAPAAVLLGGAPLVIPLLAILIFTVLTPVLNPTERMGGKAKWTGRLLIFALLTALVAIAWWYLMRQVPEPLRE